MKIKISAKEFKNVVAGIEKAVTKKAKEVFEKIGGLLQCVLFE